MVDEKDRTPAASESDMKRLAGLVHDLANRITPVIGWLEMGKFAHTEVELRVCWAKASANAPACLDLIAQIRAALKPGTARLRAVCEPGPALERTLDGFGAALQPGVKLVRNTWPNLHQVSMAAGDVDRVVFNLLDNAAAAILEGNPPRGTITVLAHNVTVKPDATLPQRGCPPRLGRYVLVSVRDEGPGMSEDVQARLFERGFTTKLLGKGTGIGLVSVQDLLVAAGGGITFKSATGKGTRFNVFFPAAL